MHIHTHTERHTQRHSHTHTYTNSTDVQVIYISFWTITVTALSSCSAVKPIKEHVSMCMWFFWIWSVLLVETTVLNSLKTCLIDAIFKYISESSSGWFLHQYFHLGLNKSHTHPFIFPSLSKQMHHNPHHSDAQHCDDVRAYVVSNLFFYFLDGGWGERIFH